MFKKGIIILITILVVIIIIFMNKIITSNIQKGNIDNFMEYINSSEPETEIETPQYMHVVLAAYKGKVKGLNILKSISYFTNNNLPEIQKKCNSKFKAKLYYKRHSLQIANQLGIDNFNDFYKLAQKCKIKEKKDEIDSISFDRDSIKKDSTGINAVLCIKYKKGEELKLNLKILNKTYDNQTSVIIK